MWEFWSSSDEDSTQTIDHSGWNKFLNNHVTRADDGINRVAYATVTDTGRAGLAAYIDELAAVPIRSYNRRQQLPYWINLYNALTLQVVLAHYPVQSIRDISISGFFSPGPWGKELIRVAGNPLTLDDIEHRILRPIWRDPRIHYALNCASLGCPDLQPLAYTADNTDKLLNQSAITYVNHQRGAEVTSAGLVVSSIYRWFKQDFGGNDVGVINHLREYAKPELAAQLQTLNSIARNRYDWAINDTSTNTTARRKHRGSAGRIK